jgi:hypothetical protein
MFLNAQELKELTKRKRSTSQIIVLRSLGIEHKVRPDGSVLVLRGHVERLLGGSHPLEKVQPIEPNWRAI